MSQWLLILSALVAGLLIPLQVRVNASLGQELRQPAMAGLMSFIVGTAVMLMVCLALVASAKATTPSVKHMSGLPVWIWAGGLLGAIFVTSNIVLAPRLGTSIMICSIVAGQLIGSMTIDHFGLIGAKSIPISPTRIIGGAMLLLAVLLIQFGDQWWAKKSTEKPIHSTSVVPSAAVSPPAE